MLKNKRQLIPFLMAGYPSIKESEGLFSAMIEEGAEIVEVGVPFSDPLADGPTIQHAASVALEAGTNLEEVLAMVGRLSKKHPKADFVLFTYLNPLLQFGLQEYVKRAVNAGVTATLTVDLPPEEAKDYLQIHRDAGLKTVFLTSPTTSPERLPVIANASTGFIYYVSRAGVTGAQRDIPTNLSTEVHRIREILKKPVAVGFGISSIEQVMEVASSAEAVVVGSHLLNLVRKASSMDQAEKDIREFVRSAVRALQDGRGDESQRQ